ncbi:MAG: cupin domain-containing protein [Planctomycetota bacterium]|nr:cupin domain-containing protein [Planctomycetota bacterium]
MDPKAFTLMRAAAVNRKTAPNGKRTTLYYCDPDIDFVVTTSAEPCRGDMHRHRETAESYYVQRGTLIMHVDGQRLVLKEGDLLVIQPRVCHGYETAGQEVCFVAVRKQPQSGDKEPC